MTDRIDPTRRSANMARIRGKNTVPELRVRSALHKLGFRFRLHRSDLPGTPDIVLPKYRTVVLVHGCFWHRHLGCKYAYTPKSRVQFWQKKFADNVERDQHALDNLGLAGWRTIVIWECETRDSAELEVLLRREIGEGCNHTEVRPPV
jgi:DNA mismatch endonuclease, patch repair protein